MMLQIIKSIEKINAGKFQLKKIYVFNEFNSKQNTILLKICLFILIKK